MSTQTSEPLTAERLEEIRRFVNAGCYSYSGWDEQDQSGYHLTGRHFRTLLAEIDRLKAELSTARQAGYREGVLDSLDAIKFFSCGCRFYIRKLIPPTSL